MEDGCVNPADVGGSRCHHGSWGEPTCHRKLRIHIRTACYLKCYLQGRVTAALGRNGDPGSLASPARRHGTQWDPVGSPRIFILGGDHIT